MGNEPDGDYNSDSLNERVERTMNRRAESLVKATKTLKGKLLAVPRRKETKKR